MQRSLWFVFGNDADRRGVAKEGSEGEEPAGTELEAAVTKDAVEFENFPIRSLIAAVLGESGSDAIINGIIEAVGPVSYAYLIRQRSMRIRRSCGWR
mgnify:CR=1 FL=1